MPQEIDVRPAERQDLPRVQAIHQHYVSLGSATLEEEPRPAQAWQALLDRLAEGSLPFLVTAADDTVTGFIYAAPMHPGPAHRHVAQVSVYLAPDAVGRGVGSRLMSRFLQEARAAGLREIIALVNDMGSESTVRFLKRHGYTEAGRLRGMGMKDGQAIDTLLLQRSLGH
ncbi:N-acetyltransferase family protein [Streptomyces sp. NPDC052727]|uniref:GNAT family N-acetyltransferase n=1 Tax=Streptomyces sp. NPDC052727 TaxID=3154854 RepID=UPI00341BDB1B